MRGSYVTIRVEGRNSRVCPPRYLANTMTFADAEIANEPSCQRCGSSVMWEDCDSCDEGMNGHDCGEDTCCCLEPEDNMACDICEGQGGWYVCLSSAEWCRNNPLPGREEKVRGVA